MNALAELVTSSHYLPPEKLFQRIVITYKNRAAKTLLDKLLTATTTLALHTYGSKEADGAALGMPLCWATNSIMLVILFVKIARIATLFADPY